VPEQKQVEEAHEYVTLEELCEYLPERDVGETHLERYGKWIKYRRRVALERIVYWQRRYMGKKKDYGGMMTACLVEVMIEPKVDRQQAAVLLKADGRVMLEIVNEVLGDISEDMEEELADEVGEL
jgi:hypothetical protein